MLAIVLLVAMGAAEEVLGDVFYKYPAKEYYPAEMVKYYVKPEVPVVPVSYYYKDVPQEHHHDKMDGGYYLDDGLKKSVHDAEESSLHAVQGHEGDHKLAVETIGKHDYDHGLVAGKKSGEGKVVEEKLRGYEASTKDDHDNQQAGGYKKGQKTSGFRRTYHNEESGKEHHFVDEDHTAGQHKMATSHDDLAAERGLEGYSSASSGGGVNQWAAGKGGEGSALRSAAAHHGRKGSYGGHDGRYLSDLGSIYHRGGRAGHHYGNYEPVY